MTTPFDVLVVDQVVGGHLEVTPRAVGGGARAGPSAGGRRGRWRARSPRSPARGPCGARGRRCSAEQAPSGCPAEHAVDTAGRDVGDDDLRRRRPHTASVTCARSATCRLRSASRLATSRGVVDRERAPLGDRRRRTPGRPRRARRRAPGTPL